jgi:hypothetical protein
MVKTLSVADQREFVNALFYGDGGTGKTTNLATLANLGRVLYVDAESGIKRKPLENLGVDVTNIELLTYEEGHLNFKELEDAFWSVKSDLDTDPDAWVGMVWDSGTEIYHALLDTIVSTRVTKAEAVAKKGGRVHESMLDRFFIDRDNYGVMSEQIRLLLRRFRDLPCHFGIAFLERRDQNEKTGEVRIGPAITPGLQSDVIGWHDVVCRTTYDSAQDVYYGTFRPEGVRQGKDRYGLVPKQMVTPSMERIVKYVTGELTETDDPVQASARDTRKGEITEEPVEQTATEATAKPKASPLDRAKAAAAARA